GAVGAVLDGLADGAHSLDAVGDGHPVRRRHFLFPGRADRPAAAPRRSDPVRIRLFCPTCATPGRLPLPGPRNWTCPVCEHVVELAAGAGDHALSCCAACGCEELYRKKDFPHGLGMSILVAAFIASTITYGLYDKVLTWIILLGSFAFDG